MTRRPALAALLALACIWTLGLRGDARQRAPIQAPAGPYAQHSPARPVLFAIGFEETGKCSTAYYTMKGSARYALLPAWDGQRAVGTAESFFALRGSLLGLRPGETVQFYVKTFNGTGEGSLAGAFCNWSEATADGRSEISFEGHGMLVGRGQQTLQEEGSLDTADAWFVRTAGGGELRVRWRRTLDNSACSEVVSDTADNHGFTESDAKRLLTFTLTDDDLRRWSQVRRTNQGSVEALRELGCDVSVRATFSGSVPAEDETEASVTVDGYDEWQPQGNINAPDQPGNRLWVDVKVHKRGEVSTPRKANLTFTLPHLSDEPGVCINWPASGGAGKDLRLEGEEGQLQLTIGGDGLSAKTTTPVEHIRIAVAAYDYGAWGTLRVTGTDEQRRSITVKVRGKDTPDLDIPLDEDANRIADSWKPDSARGKPGDADDEGEPKGNGFQGDGLTLYEEYRGFAERGAHVQGNPVRKDFFVLNQVGDTAKGGLKLFAQVSELAVHDQFTADELDWTRVINRHSRSGHEQHGIIVSPYDTVGDDPSFSQAVGGPGTPRAVSRVLVSAKNTANPAEVSRTGDNQPITDADAEIAHELLHACNVWHHGEGDHEKVIWTVVADRVVEYDDDNHAVIRPLREDGSVVDLRENGQITVWLGVLNGQHSGAEICLMRYHKEVAAYRHRDGGDLRYLTDGGQTGLVLCQTDAGTGVNGSNHSPQSRWGDATKKRGNCKGQIVVSDRYTPPGR